MNERTASVVIVGGGPAGLAPLFAAANEAKLDELLDSGVVILDESDRLGSGSFREYAIRSDSTARAFLDIVLRTKEPRLAALASHPATLALMAHHDCAVPLSLVSLFLEAASKSLAALVAASQYGAVLTGKTALSVTQSPNGLWRTRFVDLRSGLESEIESHSVLLATGAHQPAPLLREEVGGQALLPRYEHKLWQSHAVLVHGGVEALRKSLGTRKRVQVVVLGGSSSAGAVVHHLLHCLPEYFAEKQSITLMHRSPLRLYYASVSAARQDGYTAFDTTDVCPLTGGVFRFGGFRLDSRDLFRPGPKSVVQSAHPSLTTCFLPEASESFVHAKLEEADLIITAFGYQPRLLPIYDSQQCELSPDTSTRARRSWVDGRCRVLNRDHEPLAGLYALGLAAGPRLDASFGGEANFHGQVNSLWLWQHTLGLGVATEILARQREIDAALRHEPTLHAAADLSISPAVPGDATQRLYDLPHSFEERAVFPFHER